jgi:HD-GYP domain-containing protein (c-di-GMP phosphodiesterase class II)
MLVATVVVMVLPAAIVGALGALGVISGLWASLALSALLALGATSLGSGYWRRHHTGDVLFSDLLLWGWLRRGRMERRLGRADELLDEAGSSDAEGKSELLHDLGVALDAQDPYLDGHSRRVARYATMTASRMDLSDEQAERVRTAAMIHDVGKLRIPEQIVNKSGRLSDDEFAQMKQHAPEGARMVECLGDPALAAVVRAHHERWDGSGYPDGLAGEQIPLEARIISVVDTFDAITSARSYRAATPHAKALKIIDEEAGRQFEPEAARAFISCYSDRRGAALWAALASMPRQVAERLSITPGEIAGVAAAAVTAPLVVVAGAMAAETLPSRSEDRPAISQAVVTSEPTVTPSAQQTTSPRPSTSPAARTATPPAEGAGTPAGEGAGGSPAQSTDDPQPEGDVAGAQATSTPTPVRGASTPSEPTAAPTATPEPEPPALARGEEALPPWPPNVATPAPEPTPAPTPEPLPPEPTPDPLPPLLPDPLPPVLPTPTPTPTPMPPTHSKDDCKNNGWMDLGYENQGQCIADAADGGAP